MINVIVEFLKSVPAIIGVILELKRIWNQYLESSERRKKMIELQQALKEARETKNTSKVEALFSDITSSSS